MKPGVRLLRMPAGTDAAGFIAGGCGLVTSIHAIERAEVRLGSSVVVLGAGPVGIAAAALARRSGADPVVLIGEPPPRRDHALRMGATHALGLEMPAAERASYVRGLMGGRGADIVIEAAGDPRAVTDALDLVRDGGRVVIAGQYTDHGDVSVNPHRHINRKHVEIRGCWGSDYSHFHRALQVLATVVRDLPWTAAISASYSLDRAGEALAAVERREVIKALIEP